MKTIYVADDGKTFEEEDECRYYEADKKNKEIEEKNCIYGIEDSGQNIEFSDPDFCNDSMALYLKNDEAVKFFNDRCEREGLMTGQTNYPGFFIWNNGDLDSPFEIDVWLDITEVIKFYKEKIEMLQGFMKKLNPDENNKEKEKFNSVTTWVYEKNCGNYTKESNYLIDELLRTCSHIKVTREKNEWVEVEVDTIGHRILDLLSRCDMLNAYGHTRIEYVEDLLK